MEPGTPCIASRYKNRRRMTGPEVYSGSNKKDGKGLVILNQAGTRRFRAYTSKHLDELLRRAGLDDEQRLKVRAVATVLPFRTNAYVVDELIDWSAAPDDPYTVSSFPRRTCFRPRTSPGWPTC